MNDRATRCAVPADGGLGISPSELMRTAQHGGWTGNGPGQDSCVFTG